MESTAVRLSSATVEDADAIFDLQRRAYQTEAVIYDDFAIPPLLETLDQLRDQFRFKRFLKASINGRVVGSVRAFEKEGTCYIERLIVDPEHRRQGMGTALLNHIEAAHPAARRFELFTGHKSINNLRLYERIGYRPIRRQAVNEKLVLVFLEKAVVG